MIKKIRRFFHKVRVTIDLWRHSPQLKQQIETGTQEYRKYLKIQLRRTLSKRKSPLRMRTKLLVDKLSEFVDLNKCDVLCIGPRNIVELDYIRSKGAKSVTGIDLYSEHTDIKVMDMHDMTFADNSFDVVYSSHSLEHSYDIKQVVNEIIRVARPNAHIAIEMPIQFEPQGADLVNIENIQALRALFDGHISQNLWVEEQPPHTPRNDSGASIVRVIFALDKKVVNL